MTTRQGKIGGRMNRSKLKTFKKSLIKHEKN